MCTSDGEKMNEFVLNCLLNLRIERFPESDITFEVHEEEKICDDTHDNNAKPYNSDTMFETLDFGQIVKLRSTQPDNMPVKFSKILSKNVNLTLQLNDFFQQKMGLMTIRSSVEQDKGTSSDVNMITNNNNNIMHNGYMLREIYLTMSEKHNNNNNSNSNNDNNSALTATSYGLLCVDLANLPPKVALDVTEHKVPFGQSLEQNKIDRQVCIDGLWQVNIPSNFFNLKNDKKKDEKKQECVCTTQERECVWKQSSDAEEQTPAATPGTMTYGRTVQIWHKNVVIAKVLEILNPVCFDVN